MYEDLYDGVPVVNLPVFEVDVPDPVHLHRSLRYPNAVDVDPAAAIEAALDPCGLIARDPKSRTGEAIRIVGVLTDRCSGAGRRIAATRASPARALACRHRLASSSAMARGIRGRR
ncbi:MAG: hypothetical protein ACRDT0_08725 [Pseudonocardiaceae bacterium]